jgi:hypothetical protein
MAFYGVSLAFAGVSYGNISMPYGSLKVILAPENTPFGTL